jgi:hypothetical protein
MHRRNLICAAAWVSFLNFTATMPAAPPPPPRYDHVVIVIEENKGYNTIIGSSSAPYINKLAAEGTNFTNFYAFKPSIAALIAAFGFLGLAQAAFLAKAPRAVFSFS